MASKGGASTAMLRAIPLRRAGQASSEAYRYADAGVELRGIEPLTFRLPAERSPS